MKKYWLLLTLVILLFSVAGCTEDEAVEASINQTEFLSIESGEEGDQEIDTERD